MSDKNPTVYKVGEIKGMISEELSKQYKIKSLKEQKDVLKEELENLEEGNLLEFQGPAPVSDSNQLYNQPAQEEEADSIFDARPGETITFNFQDVTIKAQRQLDDMFKIVDASESKKLRDGDYIKIKGNDILQKGRKLRFSIFREAGVVYESNPLQGWKIIKNR